MPGPRPEGNALSSDERTLFVANRGDDTLVEIDTDTMTCGRRVKTRSDPNRIYRTSAPDGRDLLLLTTRASGRFRCSMRDSSRRSNASRCRRTRPRCRSIRRGASRTCRSRTTTRELDLDTWRFVGALATLREADASYVLAGRADMHDASPPDGMPDALVDAHHHLWRLDAGAHPWLQADYDPVRFMFGDYAVLCRDFGVDALRHAAQGAPIVASVHVEAERARDEALAETRWLHEVAESHGLPSAVVAWVDLLADDADERLAEQAAWPRVRGVRFKPRTSAAPDASVDGPGTLRDRRWPASLARRPAWAVLGSARTVLASRGSGFDARRCTGCRRRARTCRTAGIARTRASRDGDAAWRRLPRRRASP